MSLPDVDIAHSANMKNIAVIGDQLGIPRDSLKLRTPQGQNRP
ncbi:MAG: hypothetical protein OSB45_10745 [Pseudomonadales bacterium]|jgi:formyltetrahydrofolate synthetase|nr:hypothetical protein [Pseudomonadales bacterium]